MKVVVRKFNTRNMSTLQWRENGRRQRRLSNISKEKEFRGFAKKPVVLLERCDKLLYLNNNNFTYKQKANADVKTNRLEEQIDLHLRKLELRCSVVLVREDLEKLNRDVCRKYIGDGICKSEVVSKGIETASNTEKKQDKQTDIGTKVNKDNAQPKKRVSFSDHIIVHVVDDYHRCRKCSKLFKDYKCLKLHIRKKHRKRKRYSCNYCSKIFLDRILFKNHIKLHCDICGILTQNKIQYMDHKRNVCRSKKIYNCKTCNKNYFKFMDLKEHSYEHIGSFYICDICKDQFENKCALLHHISFLHSEKHPKELYTFSNLEDDRRYQCNFCNQKSLDKSVIESHTSVLPDLQNQATTTYKDYYFCDQCLRRFDTETNMLQHKSHNLKTSDNSQLRQDGSLTNRSERQDDSNFDNNNTRGIEEEPSVNKNGDKDINEDHLYIPMPKKPAIKSILYNVLNPLADANENFTKSSQVSSDMMNQSMEIIDYTNPPKKAIVDPKSKKTLLSRFNCELCGKYYSSNYTLLRHKATQHSVIANKGLQCNVCEETFVWPSLLKSHKCIRANIPEMPFDDARPEILFENMRGSNSDPFNGEDDDMMGADFDMPAPIVELTEYDQYIITEPTNQQYNNLKNFMCVMPLSNTKYKLVVQEVPIEF